MKKIMFNDRYHLTQAVLEGRKTMTRRPVLKMCKAIQELRIKDGHCEARYGQVWFPHKGPNYNVGEIVAVAQRYMDLPNPFQGRGTTYVDAAGWRNKMFVRPEDMPHQILITDVKIERLRDISDEDCFKEGIQELGPCSECGSSIYYFGQSEEGWWSFSPRDAFEGLINKICPKLTWEANPWVFVYTFKLLK